MQVQGSNVSAPVVPNDSADIYPSHLARYGQGGWHTGHADVAARDAIPAERRDWRMVVPLLDGTIWELVPGVSSNDLGDNGNWQPFNVAAAFAPLLATEIPAQHAAAAGLQLRPLLIYILGQVGTGTGTPATGSIIDFVVIGDDAIDHFTVTSA